MISVPDFVIFVSLVARSSVPFVAGCSRCGHDCATESYGDLGHKEHEEHEVVMPF